MKLSRINVDRFGARSNLLLDSLSPGLNAIYGPNGSGKSTLIQFIRWVLHGRANESCLRYLHQTELRCQGTLETRDQHGQAFTLHRADDGTTNGSFSIRDARSDTTLRADLKDIRQVSAIEFDTFFRIEMSEDYSIGQLIRRASDQGLLLTAGDVRCHELQALTERLNDRRAMQSQLSSGQRTRTELEDRRIAVSQRMDEITAAIRQHREKIECEYRDVYAELGEQRRRLDHLDAMLHQLEARIEARQRDCDDQLRRAEIAREDVANRRHQRVGALELQIVQWRELLDTIRHRLGSLQGNALDSNMDVFATDGRELHAFLRNIELQLDAADSDVADFDHELDGYEDRSGSWRLPLDSLLKAVRDDVSQLCRRLDSLRTESVIREHHGELDHLRRCEAELSRFIESLSERRDSLADGDDYRHPTRAPLPYAPADSSPGPDPWATQWALSQLPMGQASVSDHDDRWPMLGHRVAQIRLHDARQRRDMLRNRRHDLGSAVSTLEQRLQELDSLRSRAFEDAAFKSARRESEQIEAELRSLDERDRLRHQIAELEEQICSLRIRLEPTAMLQRASHHLSRLTSGGLTNIRIENDHPPQVEDRSGRSWHVEDIGRGGRDQVRLSLCLAIVHAYRERGIELPVILNDAFSNLDIEAVSAAVKLIGQLAQDGFQVLVFTRQQHVLRLLQDQRAKSYTLVHRGLPSIEREPEFVPQQPLEPVRRPEPAKPVQSVKIVPPARPFAEPKPTWTAQWRDHQPSDYHNQPPTRKKTDTRVAGGTADDNTASSSQLEVEQESSYPLSDQSSIETLRSIDVDTIGRLKELGIASIRQFLDHNVDELHERLASLRIDRETAARWRAQALLERHVEVTGFEARLLVAAGYTDPTLLAGEDANEILRRIDQVLNRTPSDRYYGSLRNYDRNAAERWIRSARRSSWRSRERTTRSNESVGTPDLAVRPSTSASASIEPPSPAHSPSERPTVRMSPSHSLRFYLELSDPVVDAPSIGPKTAAQLETLGIHSVSDLLKGNAKRIAEQLDQRRITEAVVRRWLIQAELVYRIPNLRGHDAQILEACGISQPMDLAGREPRSLYQEVASFVGTNEGKRILRSGKKPDLHEVTSWIQWAQSARTLRAA